MDGILVITSKLFCRSLIFSLSILTKTFVDIGDPFIIMASKAVQVQQIQMEIKSLQIVNDGIISVKDGIIKGNTMSTKGYNVMDNVHNWIKTELSYLKWQKEKLSDINLV